MSLGCLTVHFIHGKLNPPQEEYEAVKPIRNSVHGIIIPGHASGPKKCCRPPPYSCLVRQVTVKRWRGRLIISCLASEKEYLSLLEGLNK